MTHELQGTLTAVSDEGSFDLNEWNCGPKYVVTGPNAEYCPKCGKRLGD